MRCTEVTGETLTFKEIVGKAEVGCEVGRGIWADAISALAYSLLNYSMILDPTKIVLGGGVSHFGVYYPLSSKTP